MPEPFRPHQFMEAARFLASSPADEPRLKAAVSRAYSAVFLIVRDKAHITGKERVHERAKIAASSQSSAAGGMFQTLRDLRIHADYVLKPGDLSYEAVYDDWEDNMTTGRIIGKTPYGAMIPC